jgi:hypothetical protein
MLPLVVSTTRVVEESGWFSRHCPAALPGSTSLVDESSMLFQLHATFLDYESSNFLPFETDTSIRIQVAGREIIVPQLFLHPWQLISQYPHIWRYHARNAAFA